MKKTILSMLLAVIAVEASAQTFYGYYTNLGEKCKVLYIMDGLEDKPWVLIEVVGDADENYLMIDASDIKAAQDGFKIMKAKYIEWVNVAKQNNVTEVEKRMDYPFHARMGAAWKSSKW